MKHLKLLLVVAVVSLTAIAQGAPPPAGVTPITKARRLGLGVILFGPTGLTANWFLNSKTSVDAAMAWSLNDDHQNLYLHADYLMHRFLTIDGVSVRYYYGLGTHVVSWDDPPGKDRDPETRLGGRVPLGLAHLFRHPRVEIFGELAFAIDLLPSTDTGLSLGLGGRYYF